MARSLADYEVKLNIDTCIVDEAGCVLESSIPILLRFQPNNLILIGDHKQLQPFSSIRSDPHKTTHHARSLLERAIEAGLNPQKLTIQYRMHPKICELVSKLFYNQKLETGPILRENKSPCIWFDAPFNEVEHKRRGYSNPEEAKKVAEVIKYLIRTCSTAKIFVITFYNKQRLEISKTLEDNSELKEKLAKDQISVLSVDKCQGSEADYVILSTVRSDGVNSFLLDKRRVCVALSRAKEGIWIVGNHFNFQNRGGSLWKDICSHFLKLDE